MLLNDYSLTVRCGMCRKGFLFSKKFVTIDDISTVVQKVSDDMELVQCIEDVYARVFYDYIETEPAQLLFKAGNVYPVFKDEENNWLTVDEEGEQHMIASNVNDLNDDVWFQCHFRKL